jgi:hypothetical protein
VLLPENPFLGRDPEVGAEVIARSDEIAARLAAEARSLDVPVLDLRHALPPSAFFDLNHLVPNGGDLAPVLSGALARAGLLHEARTDRHAPRV